MVVDIINTGRNLMINQVNRSNLLRTPGQKSYFYQPGEITPGKEIRMKTRNVAAIYARVSTVNHGQDPKMQTRELDEYCKRRGWETDSKYIDVGYSGSKEQRPELDRLMSDAYKRKFSCVVVWRFDRFARSVSHLLRALETFKSLGIEFISLSEQLDTTTPTGKMIFTILGSVAELERELTVERVRAGIRNARAKGRRIGRPPLRTFAPPEVEAVCKARRESGSSIRSLALQFQTTQFMVQRILEGRYMVPKNNSFLAVRREENGR